MKPKAFFDTANIRTYDVRLIHSIGVLNAMYLYEIHYYNGIEPITNTIICDSLLITESEGLKCFNHLTELGLLSNLDYDINYNNLYHIIYGDIDVEAIKSTLKIKSSKSSKTEMIKNNILKSIPHDNEELLRAYSDWYDAVCAKSGGMIKQQVLTAVDIIDKASDYNLDIALEIIKIAMINGWRDMTYAVNKYNELYRNNRKSIVSSAKLVENPNQSVHNINQLGEGY